MLDVVARQHVLSWDLERVVFPMVLHRLAEPASKLACNVWIADEAWFPDAESWDAHHFYRAFDFLDDHQDEVCAGLAQSAVALGEPEDLHLLLTGSTSTSFHAVWAIAPHMALPRRIVDGTEAFVFEHGSESSSRRQRTVLLKRTVDALRRALAAFPLPGESGPISGRRSK